MIGSQRLLGLAAGVFIGAGLLAGSAPMARGQSGTDCLQASPYFDLTFPGGTVADYVRAIRDVYPCANVLIASGARVFPVPAVSLRQVTVGAALGLIDGQARLDSGELVQLGVDDVTIPGRPDGAYRLGMWKQNESPVETSVWGLAPVIGQGLDAEAILGAVKEALSTFSQGSTMRFHEPTGLLIVRGAKEQLELVGRVLGELTSTVQQQSRGMESRSMLILDQRAKVEKAESDVELAVKRVEIAGQRLDRFMADGFLADDPEKAQTLRAEGELALAEAEASLRIARSTLERERARLKIHESAPGERAGSPR